MNFPTANIRVFERYIKFFKSFFCFFFDFLSNTKKNGCIVRLPALCNRGIVYI